MVGIVFEWKDFVRLTKWGTRFGLIALLIVGLYYKTKGTDIFYILQTEHKTTTLLLIGLSLIAFLPLFLSRMGLQPKKKSKHGGELKVMKKLYIFIIAVITILVLIVAWVFIDTEAAKNTLGGIGGGVGESIVNFFVGVNAWLGTLDPYVNSVAFFIIGIIFTLICVQILIPKIQKTQRMKQTADRSHVEDRLTPSAPIDLNKVEDKEGEQ